MDGPYALQLRQEGEALLVSGTGRAGPPWRSSLGVVVQAFLEAAEAPVALLVREDLWSVHRAELAKRLSQLRRRGGKSLPSDRGTPPGGRHGGSSARVCP